MSEEKPYVVYLPKTDGDHVPQKLDRTLLPRWNDNIKGRVEKLYQEGAKSFIVQDGPAYLNGPLHLGHYLNKTLKDILLKQLLLDGYKAEMRLGGDCHGLPIENRAKKEGDHTSDENLLQYCRQIAERYIDEHRETLHSFGVHFTAPDYLTMSSNFVQREKGIFQHLANEGLIVKKNKPTWYSPSLKTTLANSEVEHNELTDQSVYFFFDLPNSDDRLVVWTTTEWTIPGNQAVCLSKSIPYCKAGNLICSVSFAKEKQWDHAPFDVSTLKTYLRHDDVECPVLFDDFVQDDPLTTGIVHLCGGHGDEDFEVLSRNGIAPRNAAELHDLEGHMANYSLPLTYRGRDTVLRYQPITHSVTVDWRNKDRVIKVLTEQTYLDFDLTKIKGVLKQIKMTGRDRKRLEGMIFSRKDWCLSRQRKWGVPIDEDNILDVWFDSGTVFAMNDGPADIYIEGHDQHRGWFQSSTIIAAMVGRVPTKRIVSHGFVMDQYSNKLSKSSGNFQSLKELYDKFGPDVLRLWVVLSDYTNDVVFSEDSMKSAAQQYFKVRNWMRYFVNNLYRDAHRHEDVDPVLVERVEDLKMMVSNEIITNMNPSKAFRSIVMFLGNYSSGLTEPRKDRFYESELDAPQRIELENEFHYIAQEIGSMLFPFAPFLSMELASKLKEPIKTW